MKVYPEKYAIIYPALGLAEEAGEAAGKVKKWLRGDSGSGCTMSKEQVDALFKELGDVLWYVTSLGDDLGFSLLDIAQGNVDKLTDRKARGVVKGSGDDR